MGRVKSLFIENLILVSKGLAILIAIRACMLIAGYGGHIPLIDDIIQAIIDLLTGTGQSTMRSIFG